jgi:carotenoid cleavage dioxygenase
MLIEAYWYIADVNIAGEAPMSDNSRVTRGNYLPLGMECDAPHLTIVGELPRTLNGTLYRNGPDPQFPAADPRQDHWFLGDGMIHAFTLHDGKASYRNRWVRTAKWRAENAAERSLVSGFGGNPAGAAFANEGVANTNIIWHAGRLLALEEAHLPVELEPASLVTRGQQSFDNGLKGPFTAHPKTDPVTGELVFLGYSASGPLTPTITYGTIDRRGAVTRFEQFEAPYCSMVHDMAITERHAIVPVLPLSGSMARAQAGGPPFAWEPELGSHIALIRRDKGVASLRWFRMEPCYVFHILNAWEEGERVIVDVMQYDAPPLFPNADGSKSTAGNDARLVRWTLDPTAGTDAVTRQQLDDMPGEFPRLDERRTGLTNRFGVVPSKVRTDGPLDTLVWHDLARSSRTTFTLPDGDGLSETVFVPRSQSAPEGDGWLLAVAWRGTERRSDLIVLDTSDVAHGPIATVQLTHRVPFGFHGNWVGATA